MTAGKIVVRQIDVERFQEIDGLGVGEDLQNVACNTSSDFTFGNHQCVHLVACRPEARSETDFLEQDLVDVVQDQQVQVPARR